MSSSREQLFQLAKTFTQETDPQKFLPLAEQMLEAIDRVEADNGNKAGRVIVMQRPSS
jgi:hypothetical protein